MDEKLLLELAQENERLKQENRALFEKCSLYLDWLEKKVKLAYLSFILEVGILVVGAAITTTIIVCAHFFVFSIFK